MSWPWIVVVCTLAVLVVAQGLAVCGLVARATATLEQAEGLLARHAAPPPSIGTPIPDVVLHQGQHPVRLRQIVNGPVVLVVLSADCAPCTTLTAQLADEAADAPAAPVLAVRDADHDTALPVWLTPLTQRDNVLSAKLEVDRTPLAIAFDSRGHAVKSLVPTSPADILALARVAQTAQPSPQSAQSMA
ncbi:redoxin domain-containing protein [Streptomyces acidiscabies]|uniref:hypothetical protein n=1 Tax=Streptomyces acidiscabies TaxID=42234 RepID=UPI0030D55EEE